jgi:zinc transport system substrate-binding protein
LNNKSYLFVKIALVAVAAVIVCVALMAFAKDPHQASSSGKLSVVASFYPMYDFAKNVGKDRVEVKSLIPAGVEPHNFEPTPSDIVSLSTARVFILNGVVEDSWAPKLIGGINNPNLVVVDASSGIQLISSQDADEPGNDPHIWLNPVDAKKQVLNILDALVKADPAGKVYYEANAKAYVAKLDALDAQFRTTMAACKNKDIIITHATLAYFCKEYGCNQVPVEGVNAEGEPTPAVVAAIVEQAKEKSIKVVFVEKLYNPQVAQTIADEIGGKVAVFNTAHGLTLEQQRSGEDYLSQQAENVETIRANLDCS